MASHPRRTVRVPIWDGWCSVSWLVWRHAMTSSAQAEQRRYMEEQEEIRRGNG